MTFEEIGPDRIAVTGGKGHPATGRLKVAAGYRDGWIGEGQISYAGSGCVARGRLAIEIVGARLASCNGEIDEHRGELIGYDSVVGPTGRDGPEPPEIRMRYAARCRTRDTAARVAEEVEGLYLCGPSGGGGVTGRIREVIGIASGLMPSGSVSQSFQLIEA